jgi:small-conductance mechanosensitive channel
LVINRTRYHLRIGQAARERASTEFSIAVSSSAETRLLRLPARFYTGSRRRLPSDNASGARFSSPECNIGDWIRWQDKEGVIEDISFRVTRVRTFDNELLTVPNSQLATSAVVNAVAKSPRRISHTLHVGDDADLGQVASILVEEAKVSGNVLDRPTPTVRVVELDERRARVQARYWIDQPSREAFVTIRSNYLQRVNRRLNEVGIELPQN